MGERTGSRVFQWVWSYVTGGEAEVDYIFTTGQQPHITSLAQARETPFLVGALSFLLLIVQCRILFFKNWVEHVAHIKALWLVSPDRSRPTPRP
ncbi:hypothetical protein CLIM01_13570 [Colletotrichum limetticola]|uniref:Uncharacterized protein n=1 Tax=Colletotrichum limetticola TaxID=1209924 RepID=A0ABQ9PAM5_9PEZI|nr:hypothetical protein CLIM01_13570 [Colletotrichum limetticola]